MSFGNLRHIFSNLLSFGYFSKIPQRRLFIGYTIYIGIGVLLLCLPFAQKNYIGIIDNLFTAASAISTTGLATISVADNYTFFGQLVILLLIQLGGIGYMTFSSFLVLRVTSRLSDDKLEVLSTEFPLPSGIDLSHLIQSIIIFTAVFEIIGAIALYFIFSIGGVAQPIWMAVFHSISAFCTAGFGLYNDSFEQFKFNNGINITISILSYAGGIGFIVLHDLWRKLIRKGYAITFTSKIILTVTVVLTLFGTAQLYLFEPSIQQFNDYLRVKVAFFQTMTAMTTVGFNTIPIGPLHPSSLMLIILLMYIGASPSGTGGGLKSTTLTALIAYLHSSLRLNHNVTLMGNRIPDYRLQAALITFVFYTTTLFFGTYIMTFFEDTSMLQLLFEAASALGTVGLSTGITASLTAPGKIVIIVLMFIGRVGVITFGNSLLIETKKELKESDLAV